jgi:hypothetical protein
MIDLPESYAYVTMSVSLTNLGLKTIALVILLIMLRKYARETYKINILPISIYFSLDVCAYLIAIYLYT